MITIFAVVSKVVAIVVNVGLLFVGLYFDYKTVSFGLFCGVSVGTVE